MLFNMRVCFLLLAATAFVATLGAQVNNRDKLASSSSTISGIMVKPAAISAQATPTTSASSSSASTTSATASAASNLAKSPLEDMDNDADLDEDDLEDQVQAIPQPSSQSATLVPAASQDLKTAAGYHYPSHHEGGHHGSAGHHYGKYYQ